MRSASTHASRMRFAVMALAFACLHANIVVGRDFVDLRRIELMTDGDWTAGEAKAKQCAACHGDDGVSPAPTFPHLRGMTAEYLYMQLRDFKEGQGAQQIMQPIIAPMSDQDLRDTAAYYARVGNEPLKSAPPSVARTDAEAIRRGERLYRAGDAERGIAPCQGCHGEQALGHPEVGSARSRAAYRLYPPLRGQQFDYLVTKLKEYRDGKPAHSSSDFIMTGVAQTLDDESIRAVAAWASAQPLP